jgi:hypothetical protein
MNPAIVLLGATSNPINSGTRATSLKKTDFISDAILTIASSS